jgi:hypothetical protein
MTLRITMNSLDIELCEAIGFGSGCIILYDKTGDFIKTIPTNEIRNIKGD